MSDKTPQVLLVEDEPLIRMLAADMLEALGYGVIEAGAGAEALRIAEDSLNDISVMLIDLGLPDLSGEEVIRRVHLLRPGLPVIVATGADGPAAAARLKGHGIVGVLEKPYQFNDLERVMAPLAAAG
jgi:CheY-like chemotaxis protein